LKRKQNKTKRKQNKLNTKNKTKRYVAMRKLGGNKKTITATPRQLEVCSFLGGKRFKTPSQVFFRQTKTKTLQSLVRLSEALAKMRLAQVQNKFVFLGNFKSFDFCFENSGLRNRM
jgi:hypothetical protein